MIWITSSVVLTFLLLFLRNKLFQSLSHTWELPSTTNLLLLTAVQLHWTRTGQPTQTPAVNNTLTNSVLLSLFWTGNTPCGSQFLTTSTEGNNPNIRVVYFYPDTLLLSHTQLFCAPYPSSFSVNFLTIMALTMSLLLFFRARIAFALDTLACDMTSSMSLTSTPVSSTYKMWDYDFFLLNHFIMSAM